MNIFQQFITEWEDFWYKRSDERQEVARHRLRVHRLYMEGKSQFNPYLHPDSEWYKVQLTIAVDTTSLTKTKGTVQQVWFSPYYQCP